MPFPRYTTYRDDELAATLKKLAPPGQPVPDAQTLRRHGGSPTIPYGTVAGRPSTPGRSPLLKAHHCAVAYPDGATGSCRYVRIAPDFHQFQYGHHTTTNEGKPPAEAFLSGTALPTQRFGERFPNTAEAIEEKARELAASAFAAAVRHERQDRFRRATPPFGGKPDATRFQFSAKRAKEIGGKYALSYRLGDRLLPDGPLFDTIEEANTAWEDRGDRRLLVACACRWTRRWEVPRFNPLYREHPELREGASSLAKEATG